MSERFENDKHVPANNVESSLINTIRDNHYYPEQARAILHHHSHAQQPYHYDAPAPKFNATGGAELRMTDPYKKK